MSATLKYLSSFFFVLAPDDLFVFATEIIHLGHLREKCQVGNFRADFSGSLAASTEKSDKCSEYCLILRGLLQCTVPQEKIPEKADVSSGEGREHRVRRVGLLAPHAEGDLGEPALA